MEPARRSRVAYPAVIAAAVFWALSFVWYKIAYRSWGPLTVIFLRQLFAAADVQYGLSRMYQLYRDMADRFLRLFYSIEEAVN